MESPKKFGAPPKRQPRKGERFQLGIRVTSEMKRRLDAAAEQTGRSQSQEVELRLERSFERAGLLPDVLALAYGKELADPVMQYADWLRGTVQTKGDVHGDTYVFILEGDADEAVTRTAKQVAEAAADDVFNVINSSRKTPSRAALAEVIEKQLRGKGPARKGSS